MTSENQSRGSAVVKNGTGFLRFCSIRCVLLSLAVVRGSVEKGLSGVHSSYLRYGCLVQRARLVQDDFFRRRGWGGGGRGGREKDPPCRLHKGGYTPHARSTWLIAGVILARLTFRDQVAGLVRPRGRTMRRRESLGRKFRSLAGEHKSWLQIAAIIRAAEASARILQPRAEKARFLLPADDRAIIFQRLPALRKIMFDCYKTYMMEGILVKLSKNF